MEPYKNPPKSATGALTREWAGHYGSTCTPLVTSCTLDNSILLHYQVTLYTDQIVVDVRIQLTINHLKKKPHSLLHLRRNMPEKQVIFLCGHYKQHNKYTNC
jgi:hypothetical protein